MDLLLPGYEHQIVAGAGLSTSPGRPKVVLHTTETDVPSANFLINHWKGNWGSGLPHFIVENERVVQLLPLNVGAYTLENAPGGADTNRSGPAIQAEIVSRAQNDWNDATYNSVGRMLADIKRAGHNFDLGNHPRWYGANEGIVLASYSSPIRMSAQAYIDFNGWCAHQHCPENAHWDCGKKDTARLERIARQHLDGSGGAPSTPDPIPEEDIMATKAELDASVNAAADRVIAAVNKARPDDQLWMGTNAREGKVYLVSHGVKMHVPGEKAPLLDMLQFLGYDNRGVQDAALDALPEQAYNDPDAK